MRQKILVFMLALAMIMSSVACSAGVTESESETAPAVVEQTDGVVNIGANEIVVMDPHTGSATVFTQCVPQCYEALVVLNVDGSIGPRLAKEWSYTEDGLEYTFYLRDDVTFHDGSKMTANDVVYSINRLLEMGQGFAYLMGDYIKNVEVVDEYTVKVNLNSPFGPFLMTMTRIYIVSEAMVSAHYDTSSTLYGEKGDYGEAWLGYNDAGTGAYVLSELSPQERCCFTKYDNYWQGWEGDEPTGVNFLLVTEAATVRSMMANGQLDITDGFQSEESLNALDNIEGIDKTSVDQGSQMYLQMNTKCPPLDDVHVRKAIAHLVDSESLVAAISSAEPAYSLVSSATVGHTGDVTQYEFNIEKAKEELALSKYADQLGDMEIDLYWIDVVPDEQKVGLVIQAAAQQAGLTINLKESAWLAFTDMVVSEETTPALSLSLNAPDYPEAGAILISRFHSSTCGTWSQTEWLQDSFVDEKLDQAMVTMEAEDRIAIYEEVQKYLAEIVPSVAVYRNTSFLAYNSDRISWLTADMKEAGESVTIIPGSNYCAYDFISINN